MKTFFKYFVVFFLVFIIGGYAFAQAVPSVQATSGNGLVQETIRGLAKFLTFTGFANVTVGHLIMITVGLAFIGLAIKYDYALTLLVPIGVGMLIANIPFTGGHPAGIYEKGSV